MLNRTKWCFSFVLMASLQVVLVLAIQASAADVTLTDTNSQDIASSVVPPATTNDPQGNNDLITKGTVQDSTNQATKKFPVPQSQNLVDLAGKSEIEVGVDVNGRFASHSQYLEGEPAKRVEQSDLAGAIQIGKSFNRISHAKLARTDQAKERSEQALALLRPSLSIRVAHGYETSTPSVAVGDDGLSIQSDRHDRTDSSLSLRVPIFNLPNFLEWRSRQLVEESRSEEYREADGDAYIDTVKTYLSIVSSRLQSEMTRNFEAQLNDLLDYIEKRANAGAASVSDMARVKARSESTRSSRLEQDASHAAAGIEFVRLVNSAPEKLQIPLPENVGADRLPDTFDEAVALAMESNPEIASLRSEIEAAKVSRAAAKGRYYPTVDLEYTDTHALHAGGEESSAGQRDKRLMMVLNWELISGGKDHHKRKELNARKRELEYRLDDQRRIVIQNLSANYALLESTIARIASGYGELSSIATAAEAMSQRMLSGNQSLLDLLDVYERYHQVRSRLADLHILEMNTTAKLVRLTFGTPWGSVKEKNEQSNETASMASETDSNATITKGG